jgi:hypothetical protein
MVCTQKYIILRTFGNFPEARWFMLLGFDFNGSFIYFLALRLQD